MAKGSWDQLIPQWPTEFAVHRGIHLILVHHNDEWKVLVFGDGEGPREARFTTCHLFRLEDIGDPTKAEPIISEKTDIFCAGHCHMENGDVLFAGGGFIPAHYMPPHEMNLLDLTDNPPVFRALRAMNYSRWYPTCTMLMEGQVLITSGFREHWQSKSNFGKTLEIPELYDPFTNACLQVPTLNRHDEGLPEPPDYPYMFVNLGGGIIEVGPGPFTGWLSTTNWYWFWRSFEWNPDDLMEEAGNAAASAVTIQPGLYMRCGGGAGSGAAGVAHDRTAVLNVDPEAGEPWEPGPPWTWREAGRMNFGRRHHDLVLLPDQTVLAVGGAISDHVTGSMQRRKAEIFDVFDQSDSLFGTWRIAEDEPEMAEGRGYHSASLLLPDATVLVSGGEEGFDGEIELTPMTAQIYRPPYLDGDPPRVKLFNTPERIGYGTSHQFSCEMETGPTDYEVTKVALIRLGAVTHGFDQDQRYIPLSFQVEIPDPGTPDNPVRNITITGPKNAAFAPPGPYMLWVMTDTHEDPSIHVPCKVAAHVLVGNERVTVDPSEAQFEDKTIFEIVTGAPHIVFPRPAPQPRGSVWNPDKRYFGIVPEGGKAVLQVHSHARPNPPALFKLEMRIISRTMAEEQIPLKVEFWNWDVDDWRTVFEGHIGTFIDWIVWVEPPEAAGAPDDFVHPTAGRLRARIEWSQLIEPLKVNEVTWVLQHAP